jgi:beta-phosphoglucomutase family hydrolase
MKLPVTIDPRYHDAVIFDLDGVITDTASIHSTSWAEMFNSYLAQRPPKEGEDHSPFTEADYQHFVDGKPRFDGVADFLHSRGISLPWGAETDDTDDTVCGLGNRKQQLFLDMIAEGVPVFQSTVDFVRELQSLGLGTAVFSSSRNLESVLRTAGLADLFPVRIDGLVAKQLGLPGKPEPDVLLETASRLGVRPDRCVVVEDAEAGVTAGRDGGFGLVIGIDRTGHADELLTSGADAVVTDAIDIAVRTGDEPISTRPDALDRYHEVGAVVATRQPAVHRHVPPNDGGYRAGSAAGGEFCIEGGRDVFGGSGEDPEHRGP